jgi:hypothetical protein
MTTITAIVVKDLVNQAVDLVNKSNANDTTRTYWLDKLANVTLANWHVNPWGYILKGLSPNARRPLADTIAQFLCGLDMQLTSTLEQQARKPGSPLAKRLMEKGNFYSAARADSQYGSKEAREYGHKVAHTVGTAKDRKVGATMVQEVETAKQSNLNGKAFETSLTIDMLIAKYSKPVKPQAVKAETVKPEVNKGKGKVKAPKAA